VVPKHSSQKFNDSVNSILLFLVPGARNLRFLPQQFIVAFELTQFRRDGSLVPLYRGDAIDDGLDVQDLCIVRSRQGRRVQLVVLGSICGFFALDKTEEIWLVSTKTLVVEVPVVGIGFAFQDALLKMRDFMESIHVQLPNERGEVLVFEPVGKNLAGELFLVID
jgi:hypothetical protein